MLLPATQWLFPVVELIPVGVRVIPAPFSKGAVPPSPNESAAEPPFSINQLYLVAISPVSLQTSPLGSPL